VKRRSIVVFHNVQKEAGRWGGFRGQVYVCRVCAVWGVIADYSKYLPQAVVRWARVTAFLNIRHSLRCCRSVSIRCGPAAKIGMMCWSLTRDSGRRGNGSCIWMLNIEADSHSVVIQLVAAHISILVYGMEVRKPGKPSSSRRVSTELPNSSPVWDSRDVSSQNVSRCDSSWLYQGCISPLPPKSVGPHMMAWGKLHE